MRERGERGAESSDYQHKQIAGTNISHGHQWAVSSDVDWIARQTDYGQRMRE
jgi:hypothetical protein